MAKVNCIDTVKFVSCILSKNGLLFTENITALDVVKIMLNISLAIVVDTFIILNIKSALKINNITLANWMICVLIPMLYYTTKGLTLLCNRKSLLSVLEDLCSDIFNNHSEELNQHVRIITTISNVMLRYFAFAATIFVIVFCILPFITNIGMMIPPPFETGRFEVVYKIFHCVFVSYLGVNAVCFDVFYMTLMGVGIAQLNILQERLIHITANEKLAQLPMHEDVNTKGECSLKECIILHQSIIGFIKKLGVLLSFPLLVQYTCGCFTICNTIIRVTVMGETDTNNLIGILGYSSIIFAEITAYHWLANEIIYKSDRVMESCFLSKWYELDQQSQKALSFLMERAQQPLVIRLYNFIDISLDSLGVVIRWAYSIFALIKAKYN